MKYSMCYMLLPVLILLCVPNSFSQNPIIRDQFSADPSARVFNGRVYVFPSHDIPTPPEKPGRKDWFCMEDYHVFSSPDLVDWIDHGVIVRQNRVAWVDSTTYSMWAPDCIERNGKYYFYFPAYKKIPGTHGEKSFGIGVAVSGSPEGPYVPQPDPVEGVHGIDPNVFIDKDGQAYLYWAQGEIYVAQLKDNMMALASDPQIVKNLPAKGLKEGPWLFERKGIYYMTYPHVQNRIERLEYAMGDNPMGPFEFAGVIMDESPLGCWTNHQSLVKFKDQWYLFYHQDALSPDFDKNRSVCIDSLFFNADGTIRKVKPSLRGVGAINAAQKIEIDHYSQKSSKGVSVVFLDPLNRFRGWKTLLNDKDSWIRYNAVDFWKRKHNIVRVKARAEAGCILQIRLDRLEGTLLSEIKIPEGAGWKTVDSPVFNYERGIHDLFVVLKNNPVEIDWIQFAD